MENFIADQVELIRQQVGDKKVLLALSGGVDSSVVAALLIKAIGKQLTCVHVNHGLLRKGEPEQVVKVFRDEMDANLIYVDAVDRFLDKLAGVADPERKRKIIGAEFIRVFEEEAQQARTGSSSWPRAPFIPTSSSPAPKTVEGGQEPPQRGRPAGGSGLQQLVEPLKHAVQGRGPRLRQGAGSARYHGVPPALPRSRPGRAVSWATSPRTGWTPCGRPTPFSGRSSPRPAWRARCGQYFAVLTDIQFGGRHG